MDKEDARFEVFEPDFLPSELSQPEGREGRCKREAPAGWILGRLENVRWTLESLDSEEQTPLLLQDSHEKPRKQDHGKQQNSEERPHHDGHTNTPPPQVRAIRGH